MDLARSSFAQRLTGLSQEFEAAMQFVLGVSLLGLPLSLLSGQSLITYTDGWQLQWLLRLASLYQISLSLHCCACLTFAPYKVAFRSDLSESWIVPCKHFDDR